MRWLTGHLLGGFATLSLLFLLTLRLSGVLPALIVPERLANQGSTEAQWLEGILFGFGAASNFNMEGKETRFGILATAMYSVVTTAASCGAVNAMHDSFTALGGMVPIWLMQIGEVVFGGVGMLMLCARR